MGGLVCMISGVGLGVTGCRCMVQGVSSLGETAVPDAVQELHSFREIWLGVSGLRFHFSFFW